jgi:outer membrane protein OmpA-like peptidoglycan-associated protein
MNYWVHYGQVETQLTGRLPGVAAEDTHRGIMITIQDLRFVADQSALLPEEQARLDAIADTLRGFIGEDYTIHVDGHAADIGEAEAEQALSEMRASTIVAAMTARGIPADLFVAQGHGGTAPLFDNSTPEGRAQNRRVEITVVPQSTDIQRN